MHPADAAANNGVSALQTWEAETLVRFSVLDQSTAAVGVDPAETIRDTVEMGVLAEQLGYHRFWVSEHHNHAVINGTAPEIVMAALTQRTSKIRLGSAGVLLPLYAPLKVAEQFRVLESLAPGRIDLGLGRAPGGDPMTAMALNPDAHMDGENFPSNVRDVMAWVAGAELPDTNPFNGIQAHPAAPTAPEVWMLGTSDYGARLAADLGAPYCFAHFITDGMGVAEAFKLYRDLYQPSERFPAPVVALCVWALAADTREEAEHLFATRAYNKARRQLGRIEPLAAPDAIDWNACSEQERQLRDQWRANAVIGTGPEVADKLHAIGAEHGVDEMVVLTWTHSQEARRKSYTLIAEQVF